MFVCVSPSILDASETMYVLPVILPNRCVIAMWLGSLPREDPHVLRERIAGCGSGDLGKFCAAAGLFGKSGRC